MDVTPAELRVARPQRFAHQGAEAGDLLLRYRGYAGAELALQEVGLPEQFLLVRA
ncbi:MAG: hypothetical protein AB7P02_00495 [Alphaproteobacteria bacterium]